MPQPRLLALATAVPDHVFGVADVRGRLRIVFPGISEAALARMNPVFENAGIDTRYSCVPLDWFETDHGWPERNDLYLRCALDLIETAASRALDQLGIGADAIDHLVVVSTTGVATPSLDARLMERLPFRRDLARTPVFGLGCCGGVQGLARAASLARGHPDQTVLVVVVEPCALTFRRADHSKSNLVATALFGDGAAAAVVACRGAGPVIAAAGEHTWPDSLDVMGWGVEADGLRVIFSRDIPALIRERYRDALDGFLRRSGLALGDIDGFICHPGGAKVLDAIEDALGLQAGGLADSRATLRAFGNMSAASVLFVLRRALSNGGIGRRALMTALGPGFTAGFVVLENDGAAAVE